MLLQRALLLALAQNSPSGMKPLSCFKFAKNILMGSLQFYLFIFLLLLVPAWCQASRDRAVPGGFRRTSWGEEVEGHS